MVNLKDLCNRAVKAIATVRAIKGWDAANRIAIRWSLWASKRRQRTEATRQPKDVAKMLMLETEPTSDSLHPHGM